ncbi:hypothetical protein JNUCC23_02590 [Peribacillus sp. JNUCC 23]
MDKIKQTTIQALALFITAIIFIIPGYLFSDGVKVQAEKGWDLFNKQVGNLSAQVVELKSLSFSDMFSGDGGDDEKNEALSPIGNIRVITSQANIRATPEVPVNSEENIVNTVVEGQEFPYYDSVETDKGDIWYKLIDPDTGEELWISEITVEVVK